jgi:hypothetical protein
MEHAIYTESINDINRLLTLVSPNDRQDPQYAP